MYFNHPEGRVLLLETFLSPTYLNTIQTACPWILRYLAAAAILARRSSSSSSQQQQPQQPQSARVRHALKEVVKIVAAEEYQYSDPLTRFLKELYVNFDFEKAQVELRKVGEGVVEGDFFLGEFGAEVVEGARGLISEAYCRIYEGIDIE